MSKIFYLDPEVTRQDFDRVFDAHWHSAFLIRHLIYSRSRGEDPDELSSSTPDKSKPLTSESSPKRRNTLKRRLRAVDTDTDDDDENY